jgi:hypothetical protein
MEHRRDVDQLDMQSLHRVRERRSCSGLPGGHGREELRRNDVVALTELSVAVVRLVVVSRRSIDHCPLSGIHQGTTIM